MKDYVVVTGGGGFIGHYLVSSLTKNHRVIVLDNFSRGTPERLADLKGDAMIIKCDITDFVALENCLKDKKITKIFHLAAINGTENFYKIPIKIMDVGIFGCFNILKFSKKYGVKKVILASSAGVYQESKIIPTPEDIPLVIPDGKNPRFSYGLSKIYTEYYSYHFGIINDMDISIFRPHNVYGPDMGLKHVIPQFIMEFLTQIHQNSKVKVKTKGSLDAIRAFCYVDDIISGIKILSDCNQGVNIYNLGNMKKISMRKLIQHIANIIGCEYSIFEQNNEHIGGTMLRCPDIAKAEKLGFTCNVTLDDG